MDKKGRKKLAELAVNGDTDAFSKLYGEIYKELYYYALANLQNAEDAADAVQDAVLDGYMSISSLRKSEALVGRAVIGGKSCLVMKPETFMNNSGEAVSDAMDFYDIPLENVVVVYDDISLDVGKMRIRRNGSAGGHNGIKSIIALCGGQDFPRVKIGVGKKPHPDYNLADWVLSRFTDEEMKKLSDVDKNTCEAVELMVQGKINEAMNKFN